MTATVAHLYRYPVKSMLGERLETVALEANKIFPGDRQFAIAHQASAWDAAEPGWRPKSDFVNLARVEKLAGLTATLNPDGSVEITRGGKHATGGNPATPVGRAVIEQFLAAYLGDAAVGPVRMAHAADNALTDVPMPFVSIINTASVADLERVISQPVDPRRFRGNIMLQELPAWAEFDWIGREISIGEVRLKVEERIGRCAATGVNPETAQRDLNIVRTLSKGWRHTDMGVYATVIAGGTLATGDTVSAG